VRRRSFVANDTAFAWGLTARRFQYYVGAGALTIDMMSVGVEGETKVKKNRSLLAIVAMLVLGMVVTAGYGTSRATAQDAELSADLVSGDCDSPGDSVGSLRALAEAEGGVLTSFTRVDMPIDDITGDDHAVVVSLDGDVAACGNVSGSGSDVYIAVTSQTDDGYGGIAWLHARDEQTQVSLFVSTELGGSNGNDNGNGNGTGPEPPDDDTPTAEPPDEETPTVKPTRTPKGGSEETPTAEPSGDTTTYESPTFGYTLSYDDTWQVLDDSTTPSESGPVDVLNMFNGTSFATFRSVYAPDDIAMDAVLDWLENNLKTSESITSVEVREDDNGDPIRSAEDDSAIIAFDITWTNDKGDEVESYIHQEVRRIPGQGAIVLFTNEGQTRSYDQQAGVREALMDTLEIPS